MAHGKEDRPKLQFPLDSGSYNLGDKIGIGVSAVVYKAHCIPLNSTEVAIKTIDLDQSKTDLDKIGRETKTLSLLSHPNILSAYCSFMVKRKLWVVMPFMAGGSLQSIISSSFPDGLSEQCISIVLKETLNALSYLHNQGYVHRDIKAGNILVDSNGCVKLADFGVSASIYESSSTSGSGLSSSSSPSLMLTDVTGTPYWMAPEVLHSERGYSLKADIWSFGITALELAHGKPPLSHLPPSDSLLMKITKRFRFSDYVSNNKKGGNKKFSKAFKDMVASCLVHDPAKRPTADKLLKHPFFKNCNGAPFLVRNVLQGLPSVEQRFKASKAHGKSVQMEAEDEDVDRQARSQLVKQRRISGWNFNEEGFEMVPVFPIDPEDDSTMKQIRIGGLNVIPSESGEDKPLIEGTAGDLSGVEDAANPETVTPKSKTESGEQKPLIVTEETAGDDSGVEDAANLTPNRTTETGEQKLFISRFPGDVTGLQLDTVDVESVLKMLIKLKSSLEDQRERVIAMISMFGGEKAMEDPPKSLPRNWRL